MVTEDMVQNPGQFYDRTSSFQEKQFETLCLIMRRNIPCDRIRKVIDVGSGTGARTLDLFDVFPKLEHIYAIEPDPEMLSVAKSDYMHPKVTYFEASAENISKIIGDIDELDLIFANWSLHWVKDKGSFLEVLSSKINPKCYLALSICEKLPALLSDLDSFVRAELAVSGLTDPPWYYLSESERRELLNDHGWRVLEQCSFQTPHFVSDSRSFLEHWFAASTAKFLYGRQMEQISEPSVDEILRLLKQKYPDPDHEGGLMFFEDVTFCVAQVQ